MPMCITCAAGKRYPDTPAENMSTNVDIAKASIRAKSGFPQSLSWIHKVVRGVLLGDFVQCAMGGSMPAGRS